MCVCVCVCCVCVLCVCSPSRRLRPPDWVQFVPLEATAGFWSTTWSYITFDPWLTWMCVNGTLHSLWVVSLYAPVCVH